MHGQRSESVILGDMMTRHLVTSAALLTKIPNLKTAEQQTIDCSSISTNVRHAAFMDMLRMLTCSTSVGEAALLVGSHIQLAAFGTPDRSKIHIDVC